MKEITVKEIKIKEGSALQDDWMCKTGELVSIRPVGEEYEKKTFLGIYLGTMAQAVYVKYNNESKAITAEFGWDNPAIFVPALKKTIYGYESWWGKIESEDQLQEITDNDINNVWYVKALKEMASDQEKPAD